jgi:uncharacterized protein YdaU (DUF1376 family)
MAENKKSFVLYADLIKSIDHLTNEEKGILFTHLLEYVNDKNPILTDRLILTAWKPIELQLKRDLVKFEEVKAKRSDAGKRSAELRALKTEEQNATNSTSVESVKQTSTNPTDNDNVNVNVNVNDNVNDITKVIYYSFDDFWLKYPNKVGKVKCKAIFDKIPKTDLHKVEAHLNNFILNKPFKDYNYPHPSTYLTQKRYLDEIEVLPLTINNLSNEQQNEITRTLRKQFGRA